MTKAIQISNRQRALRFPRELSAIMRKCTERTLLRFGLDDSCELSISIVSPRTIKRLNRDYRNMDVVTDVLSFPAIDWRDATPGQRDSLPNTPDQNPETGRTMLGDIILCLAQATEQAEAYGHSLQRELCFLTVHGALHLLGFDHMTEPEEQVMQALTESILSDFDLVRKDSVDLNIKK